MAKGKVVLKQMEHRLATGLRSIVPVLGKEVVNFSLESFEREAWQGYRQEPWKKRKNPTKWGKQASDKKLLTDTGRLRRSIRTKEVRSASVTVVAGGSTAPYGKIHNFGFRGQVKQKVNAYTYRRKDGIVVRVNSHTRTINQNIPRRQFIGGEESSPYLKKRLQRIVTNELSKIIK